MNHYEIQVGNRLRGGSYFLQLYRDSMTEAVRSAEERIGPNEYVERVFLRKEEG